MSILGLLIPVSLMLGGLGLLAFIWSIRSRQFDDPEGDQYRALFGRDDSVLDPEAGHQKGRSAPPD